MGLDSSLVLLVPQVLLDASTNWDGTVVLIAVLGVRDAEENKVLADRAHVPLASEHESALPGVREDTLHLDAAGLLAAGVFALSGMDQEPDALLDGSLALLFRVLLAG